MKVYRISKCKYIDDLSGTGSATFAGRWHSKGTHVLYTAATPSLALLESVAHMAKVALDGYCMITLDIPTDTIQEPEIQSMPDNWQQNPSPDSLKVFGDLFILKNEGLELKLPSVIMPEDFNYLINPNHKDFKKVKVLSKRNLFIDGRLFK